MSQMWAIGSVRNLSGATHQHAPRSGVLCWLQSAYIGNTVLHQAAGSMNTYCCQGSVFWRNFYNFPGREWICQPLQYCEQYVVSRWWCEVWGVRCEDPRFALSCFIQLVLSIYPVQSIYDEKLTKTLHYITSHTRISPRSPSSAT